MNIESILFKSKQLTSQMIGVYELSLSGFSSNDLAEMIGVAANLCSSLHDDIQNNIEATEIKSTVLTALKNRMHNTKTQNTFAERLKFAIKEQGMTQAELAKSVGVSQSTISSLATGGRDGNPALRGNIARALDVSTLWLLYGEGEIYGVNFPTQNNGA
ncbi:helix-turn-helix transcriptional regulator [Providencia rettgeri]|uniref:helix-turn-helix domain-containing protein n=1 Tax=Providencia TaxID=586 RepID=UPI001419A9CA|nr:MULTISPECIES: helix-turn-helix transcriptional regulator [Providencia]NIA76166.1 helix-turn-helix transcriptional regulator [Providencia rettgeri]NIA80173.1 helix-turn-helix transcriptional regulator [Providencia rettgeri]NIB03340.1 helix-turn-helix transcriptional regulator [Providencia rettgeri]NIB07517.1 helix-turn-helix transcriptional regulator [Providencia rettgeri]NIB21092.1 helix-turn-helix transcriptional regulator [Providencia rettgeri]